MTEPLDALALLKLTCTECGAEFRSDMSKEICLSCEMSEPVSIIPDALVGKVIGGKYRINSLIAAGGMGKVYSAHHEQLNAEVAIKFLPDTEMNIDRLKRFQHEARVASSVNHPGVVRILDFGVDSSPYIVMEKVVGESLSDEIARNRGIEIARALKIGINICDAMSAAHNAGLLHRDLKPSNIMICSQSDAVKIIDFGLAKAFLDDVKLTRTGETVGSPPYMSPEQCRGAVLDVRSDIYSFGCMMYEMITGRPPFQSENMIAAIFSHLEEEPKPLKQVRPDLALPKGLEVVVSNCLNKSAESRYQTMAGLKEDLINVSQGKAVKKLIPPRPRNKASLWTFARLATAFILGPAFIYYMFILEQLPPLVRDGNELAVGEAARSNGLVPVAVQERRCLNGLSKEQFFQMRRKQIDENAQLLLKPYKPFALGFEKVDFNAPWLSYQGLLYNEENGKSVVEGDSVESALCMNPLLLVEGRVLDVPAWNREFIADSKQLIEKFPYRGKLERLVFDPRKRESVATYDLTEHIERVLEVNDWITYSLISSPVQIELANTNAMDFGYNYMSVIGESDGKTITVTKEPIRVCQTFRVARVYETVSNCGHIPRGAFKYFTAFSKLRLPCTERVSLWKDDPKSATRTPDFTCILNFNLNDKLLTNQAYLTKRLELIKKQEGLDSKSLLSIYRRLAIASYAKLEQQPEQQRTACGAFYGEAIRIAGKIREANDELRLCILPEFLSTLKGDSTDANFVEQVAREHKWTDTTKDLVARAMTTGQGLPLIFWKTLSYELLMKDKNEQALDSCKRGLKFYSNNAYLYENLFFAASKLDRWDEAESAGRKVLLLGETDADTLVNIARSFSARDRFNQAIDFAGAALSKEPNCALAYEQLAISDTQVGRLRDGEAAARKYLELSTDKVKPLLTLSWVLCLQGKNAEAVQSLEQAKLLAKEPADLQLVSDYAYEFERARKR